MSAPTALMVLGHLVPLAVQVAITAAVGALLLAVELARAIRPTGRLVTTMELAVIPGLLLFGLVLLVRSAALIAAGAI